VTESGDSAAPRLLARMTQVIGRRLAAGIRAQELLQPASRVQEVILAPGLENAGTLLSLGALVPRRCSMRAKQRLCEFVRSGQTAQFLEKYLLLDNTQSRGASLFSKPGVRDKSESQINCTETGTGFNRLRQPTARIYPVSDSESKVLRTARPRNLETWKL